MSAKWDLFSDTYIFNVGQVYKPFKFDSGGEGIWKFVSPTRKILPNTGPLILFFQFGKFSSSNSWYYFPDLKNFPWHRFHILITFLSLKVFTVIKFLIMFFWFGKFSWHQIFSTVSLTGKIFSDTKSLIPFLRLGRFFDTAYVILFIHLEKFSRISNFDIIFQVG